MDNFFYRNLKREYPVIATGKGVWLKDREGLEYLDGSSGAVVSNIGHGVAEVNEAISEQLGKIAFAHTSQFVSEVGLELAAELCKLAPPSFARGRAYFVSGGSEAVETALKMARSYFVERGELRRHMVVSRWNSYHGSTQGALSVTGHPARRKPYLPLLAEHPHISPAHPYRCACGAIGSCANAECALQQARGLEEALITAGPENVMAFIGEPVVGAALGASAPADGYWQEVRRICSKYGILLIADEVMTGLGRCGQRFGLDLWQVEPDIIALGKGLSAGYMPLGAVLASKAVSETIAAGSGIFEHGFTYSGHPVACAAGLAVLKYKQKHDLYSRVVGMETQLFDGLRQLAQKFELIGDVRGKGFLCGLELVEDAQSKRPCPPEHKIGFRLAGEAAAAGLLIYPGAGSIDGVQGDHVIVAPPFTIEAQELEILFDRLAKSLEKVEALAAHRA